MRGHGNKVGEMGLQVARVWEQGLGDASSGGTCVGTGWGGGSVSAFERKAHYLVSGAGGCGQSSRKAVPGRLCVKGKVRTRGGISGEGGLHCPLEKSARNIGGRSHWI